MAVTPSTMLPLGTKAPEFSLPDVSGKVHRLSDYADKPALLVVFMCNHCPFVQHIKHGLSDFAHEYYPKGVAIVAINSNDTENYPDDSPEKMKELAKACKFCFPYLVDETQEVAKAYHAACTPDFFLFDKARKLAYRGQFDASRPGNGVPVTGADLRAACDAVLAGRPAAKEQRPSMGCNIKWKAGNEPPYFR